MKRKIFERQTIDFETGELKISTSEYVSKNVETFFMGRTTQGLEWLLKFNSLTELQVFILLIELENIKNNYVITFTKLQLEETAKILSVAEITIKKVLQQLIKNDFLIRISKSNYLANPLTFYKGGTKELNEKHSNYQKNKIRRDNIESIDL